MSKKKKKPAQIKEKSGRFDKLKTAASDIDWRLLGILLGGSLVSCVLFFFGAYTSWFKVIYIVWFVLLGGMVIAYFAINKAFTERGITVEMLPDTMSFEEKTAFVEKVRERERKTKWMLIVIVCLALPLMLDLFRLFVWDRFVGGN